MADLSGTITSGGNAQDIAQFNPARHYLSIQNAGDVDLWVRFGADAAATSPSILIQAGDTREWDKSARELICRRISVFGGTTGKAFTAEDSLV